MDWQKRYEDRDTPWDHGRPAPALESFLAERNLAGQVLVPGCGRGHDARALARHGLSVLAVDVAPLAILEARNLDPGQTVDFQVADLFALPTSIEPFDGIFEHTCLCAIGPAERPHYRDAVYAALKPGGWLLGIFFLAFAEGRDDGPPFATPPAVLDRVYDRFTLIEKQTVTEKLPNREDSYEELRLYRRNA